MRNLVSVLILAGLFNACTSSTESSSSDCAAMADRNAEKTKLVYRAIESGDTKALDTIFTDNVVDHNAGPNGEDLNGKATVIAEIGKINTYFDGLKMDLVHHATSADGIYHYATVKMSGTSKENPWGMPVGMRMEHTSVDLVKMDNGKCAEHWGFMSQDFVNQMMKGAMGAPATAPADTTKTK
jgi:hypothetical protein